MSDKIELRKKAANLRQNIVLNNKYNALSEKIQKNILSSRSYLNCQNICLYSATKGEIETNMIAKHAFENNKSVFYPRCHELEKGIMFYKMCKNIKDLEPGKYGIMEPKNICPTAEISHLNSVLTLILVPAMLFDLQGQRLGYGQGYYDRILAKTPLAVTMGLAFFEHIQNELPKMPWDIPVKFLAHEFDIIHIKD